MGPLRVLPLILLPLLTGEALAQTPWPAAPPPGSQGIIAPAPTQQAAPPPMTPGAMPQQQQQMPPCFNEFLPLREEAQKRAQVIRTATEKKIRMTQPEACAAFKALTAAEAKVVKFVSEKYASCGIPAEAVTQLKANSQRTAKMRDQICNAARPMGPAAPSLSDALSNSRVPDASSTSTGRGTLDTLTGGNPLAR